MFRKPLGAWFLVAIFLARPTSFAPAFGDEGRLVRDFFNVIDPTGADPWVIRQDDGFYYGTVTTGRHLVLIRSETLSGFGGGERKVVWKPTSQGPMSRNIWAPEIHHLDGKWYLYFAADDGENANHRLYVLENPSRDPFQGEFTLKGRIFDQDHDRWAIDGTVFRAGGRLYLVWSGWEGVRDVRQDLYLASMRDPWTMAGPRVLISRPTFPWEVRGGPPAVNEAPQVLWRGKFIHIVYSAAASWTDHYGLGLLTARIDSDLLSPSSWSKHPEPVFAGGNGVAAPGHCCFVRSPDGSENWMLYHSARHPGAGWSRLIRAQPFTWNDDGTPHLGTPWQPDVPLPLPSGEHRRRRFEAESARLEGSARAVKGSGASGGSNVSLVEGTDAAVTFTFEVNDPGTYPISIRFSSNLYPEGPAAQRLVVNDGPAREVEYPGAGEGRWSNALLTVRLSAGTNRLRFLPGGRPVDLDCLDLALEPMSRAVRVESGLGISHPGIRHR